MAITTADGWFAASKQKVFMQKTAAVTSIAATSYSLWNAAGQPGGGTLSVANATTGVIYTDTTTGAPLINAYGSGATGYLAAGRFRNSVTGSIVLYDRIFGCSPTNLTTAVPATTTLASVPSYSSRVPNGTDFTNTEILIEIATTMSATATQIAVGYTNQSGVAGRTTATSVSLSGFVSPRVVQLALQAGDTGVQSIQTITVSGATNAAGVISIIVARRLAVFDLRIANAMDAQAWDMIGGPVVFTDSCLWTVAYADSTSTGVPTLDLDIING
jgi:hypothetical protein